MNWWKDKTTLKTPEGDTCFVERGNRVLRVRVHRRPGLVFFFVLDEMMNSENTNALLLLD